MTECPPQSIQTTCAYCGVGCGVRAPVAKEAEQLIAVAGDETHPANYGRLCSKGSALGETLIDEGRLLYPQINGYRSSWDQALDELVKRLKQTIEEYGPESVALYGSGQLLTEDYYVANKLMKGFIGSANIDTNSRLCMASTVAGHKRAFGTDTVPGCYEDLELADCLILVGSNTAWCHPVLFQRIRASQERRVKPAKVVVIDPRRTDSCDIADLFLPIRPGTDSILFNGLLVWLALHGKVDDAYLEQSTQGFADALDKAYETSPDIGTVAEKCGLSEVDVECFYRMFADHEKTVTAWSQGVNQSSAGTDKVNAIINCHLATGRVGLPGSTPFSLTGQPNAMGGREVGGLANQLAAHLEFHRPDDIERVSRFWQAPNMVQQPGLTAVDLLRAVESGEIRFIWIMGTNPVVSMPDADRVKAALQICPTVVVSDCIAPTDTGQCADILLPAAGWSEKDGTVTNSERRISRQRRFRPPTGEARADWAILSEVGRRLGHAEAFAYQCPADVFREHARLSALDNDPEARPRDFHIGGLAELSDQEYDQLQPVQWPLRSRTDNGTQRMFADGKFYTPSGKAQFVPIQETISAQATEAYPLLLNTGRIRDQWHTMTRTALAPRLNRHKDEPFLELNPADAASRGINDKALVTVRSSYGQSVLRATITDQVQPGQVFAPMHWTAQNSQTGRICSVAHPEVDPYSLQPDLKRTPVQIEAFHARQHAVLICRDKRPLPDTDYGVLVKGTDCYRYELADTENGLDGLRSELMAALGPHIVQYQDSELGIEKTLWLDDGKAVAVLMIGSEYPTEVDRSWLETLFASDAPEQPSWWQVLAGVPTSGCAGGKQVCACFGVGQETITAAIREQDLESVEDIGKTLKAGTNCGSCIPELRQLLTAIQVEEV